jgi:hypothetical protein
MAFRTLRTDPFQSTMASAQAALAMSSNVSFIMTPMRNTDIKKVEQSGDWSDLIAKAQVQTRRFRREFYK